LGARFLSPKFHQRMQFERWFIHDFVRRHALPKLKDGVRILDAGSGRVEEQYLRNDFLGSGAELVTLDLFAGEGVDHVVDVAEMPFGDDEFDIVLCTQVLEHVPNPEAVCRELYRVLRPGGVAVVTAPHSAYLHNLPYHFFHFTRIGLSKILEDAGYEIESLEAQGGHFTSLAIQLHYTVKVFDSISEERRLVRILMKPVALLWRLCFGLGFKVVAVKLDEWIPFDGNTQGWSVIATKPESKFEKR